MEKLCATIKLFGTMHIVLIVSAILICVGLVFLLRKLSDSFKRYIALGLLGVGVLFIVLEFVGRIITGGEVFESLPIFAFDIFLYICIYNQFAKKEGWLKFLYLVVLPLSVISLFVVPNFYITNNATLSFLSYFFINIVLIVYSLLQVLWSEVEITFKDVLNAVLSYVIIFAFVHILNVIFRFTLLGTDANYWGSMGEDYDAIIGLLYSLISVPFVHVLPWFVIVLGLGYLLVLPFSLLKTSREKQSLYEELIALGNMKAQQSQRKAGKSASQILVRGAEKAKPKEQKNVYNNTSSGFVSVNKQVKVNNEQKKD